MNSCVSEKSGQEWARGVGAYGNANIRPIMFGGHCLYVRKGVRGEQCGDDFWERHLDGIVLPQKASKPVFNDNGEEEGRVQWDVLTWTTTVELLAKGPRVGLPCLNKDHIRRYERARCISDWDSVPIGSLLLMPERTAEGIVDSPVNPGVEKIVEESLPLAVFVPPELVGQADEQPHIGAH